MDCFIGNFVGFCGPATFSVGCGRNCLVHNSRYNKYALNPRVIHVPDSRSRVFTQTHRYIQQTNNATIDPNIARFLRETLPEVPDAQLAPAAETDIEKIPGLSELTVRLLRKYKFNHLTDVQARSIPVILNDENVIIRALTGTGKTLAYGLPIIETIAREKREGLLPLASGSSRTVSGGRGPYALILVPTRELANQVKRELEPFALLNDLTLSVFMGQTPKTEQARLLRHGVDIVVGTPGRTKDLLDSGSMDLLATRFAVIDEADEMFSLGFGPEVDSILVATSARVRQTILVSATIPTWVQSVAARFQTSPVLVNCVTRTASQTPRLVRHFACHVSRSHTHRMAMVDALLDKFLGALPSESGIHLGGLTDSELDQPRVKRAIFFTETQAEADALGRPGVLGKPAIVLHGGVSQASREARMSRFKSGAVRQMVLVATNVAARGLDIEGVDLVVQYSVPEDVENYVHRAGRTGRAGRAGASAVLYSDREVLPLLKIEQKCRLKFTKMKPTAEMLRRRLLIMESRTEEARIRMKELEWMDEEERTAYEVQRQDRSQNRYQNSQHRYNRNNSRDSNWSTADTNVGENRDSDYSQVQGTEVFKDIQRI